MLQPFQRNSEQLKSESNQRLIALSHSYSRSIIEKRAKSNYIFHKFEYARIQVHIRSVAPQSVYYCKIRLVESSIGWNPGRQPQIRYFDLILQTCHAAPRLKIAKSVGDKIEQSLHCKDLCPATQPFKPMELSCHRRN